MFFRRSLLLALVVSAALAGCARPPRGPLVERERREFTDGLGRKVAVPYPPQRIVSLAPNLTETLFALGLDQRIIGVTTYCDYPPAARTKEKVGDTLHLNLERIIALRPDLVVISTASQLENLTRRLDELAIPVYVTNPHTVREVVASLRSLGEVTGTGATAGALAGEMERRVREVQSRVADLPRPRILYVLQTGPLITVGGNTFVNDLIKLAGGASISEGETADYPQFSRETVTARAPDVIVAPAIHGSELVSDEALRRDFAATPAIANGRVVRVNPDLVSRPGPRIVDGLEELARGLHPESRSR